MSVPEIRAHDSQDRPTGFERRHRIGPVEAIATNTYAAAQHICDLTQSDPVRATHIHLINAYTVALAHKDPNYAKALSGNAVNLPDGKPLSWVSNLRRDDVPLSQIRGHELFQRVFDLGRSAGVKHFLLGSTDDVLDRMVETLTRRYPGVEIVGAHSPPYRSLTAAELVEQDERIRASGAQLVWVGLGTPKQDVESERLAKNLPVVAIAVGAAFDFTAGTLKEAPRALQRAGLEWAYRFAKEPRRLWRRYVFGNIRFLRAVIGAGYQSSRTRS